MISVADLVKQREYVIVSLPKRNNQRLIEIGLTKGETVKLVHKTPFYGPVCLEIDGQRIAIRREEAKLIMCQIKSKNE